MCTHPDCFVKNKDERCTFGGVGDSRGACHDGNVADWFIGVGLQGNVTFTTRVSQDNGVPPQDDCASVAIKFHATIGSNGSIIVLACCCLVDVGGASIISDVRRNHSMNRIGKGNIRVIYKESIDIKSLNKLLLHIPTLQ